jgi:hypothetical protein
VLQGSTFLTEARLRRIGRLNAELLLGDMAWLHRRRELLELLDDTELHRQVSVDFSLPLTLDGDPWPRFAREGADAKLLGVPLLLLQKLPADMTNFDLKDESGRSLPLMSREDNALISAATLEEMARRCAPAVIGRELPDELAGHLRKIASCNAIEAQQHLERFDQPLPEDGYDDMREQLLDDPKLGWWIYALAQSSIVMAFIPETDDRRRVLKLSYNEPVESVSLWRMLAVQFGLAPWDLWVENPFIGAANYHVECHSPPGMRAQEAGLLDIEEEEVLDRDGPFVRQVHLYASGAHSRGRSLTWVSLRSSWQGFLSSATLIAAFVLTGVMVVWKSPEKIAENPSSAPALLLLLPGLVASVVGRPDAHALKTRVLSWARRLLLLSGFAAYAAAVIVGLTKKEDPGSPGHAEAVDYLETWLRWPVYVAIGCFAAITFALILNMPLAHRVWGVLTYPFRVRQLRRLWEAINQNEYQVEARLHVNVSAALEHVWAVKPCLVNLDGYEYLAQDGTTELTLIAPRSVRSYEVWREYLFVSATDAASGADLVVEPHFVARRSTRWLIPLVLWRRRRQIQRRMGKLRRWSDPPVVRRRMTADVALTPDDALAHVCRQRPRLRRAKSDHIIEAPGMVEMNRRHSVLGFYVWHVSLEARVKETEHRAELSCEIRYEGRRVTKRLMRLVARWRAWRVERRLIKVQRWARYRELFNEDP